MNLAETIREITLNHINNGGVLLAQNARDNGFIAGTVPDIDEGVITLPTSDYSNSGIVAGFALMGRRPIYAIRYAGFGTANYSNLINYMAKIKTLCPGASCPAFVRSIGMEGNIGPIASHNHTFPAHYPGLKVFSPMSIWEYKEVWRKFMEDDDPYLVSESRKSYQLEDELAWDSHVKNANVSLFLVGGARLAQLDKEIHATRLLFNIFNIWELKPLKFTEKSLELASQTEFSIVVDSDYTYCGIADSIAKELMLQTGKPCYSLGLENRVAGFSNEADVRTPTAQQIVQLAESIAYS